MVCTTVTIPSVTTLTINSLTVTTYITSDNRTVVKWVITATGSGEYRIYVDNVLEWGSHNYPGQTDGLIYDLLSGSHVIGVQPTNNPSNRINKTIIVSLPITCNSISKDTWKPETNNPATGTNLAIVVRSTDVNKKFNIGYADAITLERHVFLSGTTDASGCYTGEIPAQADGTYKLTVCFLVLNIACPITAPIHPISITWGTKSMDLQTVILIGAGILALAYVLGQRK